MEFSEECVASSKIWIGGLQSYPMARANGPPSSRYAYTARISTNVPTSQLFSAVEMEEDCREREDSAAASCNNLKLGN